MNAVVINRERVISRAHNIARLQIPFVHQGRTLDGIDCVGLLAWVLEYTEALPAYPRDPVNGELERYLEEVLGPPLFTFTKAKRMTAADMALLQPCDIVSMQYKGPIRHVGLLVPYEPQAGYLSLVHTDSDVGHTTECLLDDWWTPRIMRVWRPQVEAA